MNRRSNKNRKLQKKQTTDLPKDPLEVLNELQNQQIPSQPKIELPSHLKPISLDSIRNGSATQQFCQSLQTRGWVLVDLPEKTQSRVHETLRQAQVFFSLPESYKKQFFFPPCFGFCPVPHKESFRILTGAHLKDEQIPSQFATNLIAITKEMDVMMIEMVNTYSQSLFGVEMNELAANLNLPLCQKEGKLPAFGMLDIAYYYNKEQKLKHNCDEHTDPGLWAFSLGSTSPGLELKDPTTNEWIAIPPKVSIIWCGDAAEKASKGKIKAAEHRVVYGSYPRLSVWHEVCVAEQAPEEVREKGLEVGGKLRRDPLDYFLIEVARGIPPTKRILPADKLKERKKAYFETWVKGEKLPFWMQTRPLSHLKKLNK